MANIVRIITKNGTNEVDLDNFNKEVVSFGRTSECDICLNEEYISRLHGCFYKENGAWFFKDLNSTYGIFFNGVKVDSGALNSNDMLVISGNNQQDIIQMVYIGNAMQPAINNAQGNTTNFCSNCGQRLEGNSLFCPYCGSSVVFDDGSETVNVNYNYNVHNETYIHDAARIKEVEAKRITQIEKEERRKHRQKMIAKTIVSSILIIVGGIVFLSIAFAIIYNIL